MNCGSSDLQWGSFYHQVFITGYIIIISKYHPCLRKMNGEPITDGTNLKMVVAVKVRHAQHFTGNQMELVNVLTKSIDN